MDCIGVRRRGGREQGHDRGYRPPSAGYRGGGGGFAERRQQEQERGQAWDQGQDTRRGDGLARGRQGQMGHRGGRQPGGHGGGVPHHVFDEGWHADPSRRNSRWQQPPMQGASDTMDEMRLRRMEQAVRSQQGQRRPEGKIHKGSRSQIGQVQNLQESSYGGKTGQQKWNGQRKTGGRRYERGGAADHGRGAWGRDSVLEKTCEPPDEAHGRGEARGGYPESESGDEDEKLAEELANVRKMAARLEARMQQKQHGRDVRASAKSLGRMDDDDDDGQGARRDRGGGAAVAPKAGGAEVAFDEEEDHGSVGVADDAEAAEPPRRRRSASPAPAEGRVEPEPAWSGRCLFRLNAEQRRQLGMQAAVAFNKLAPSSRSADVWPGSAVLSDLAAAAQRSTVARFASVP